MTAPRDPIDYAELDPGIRQTVQWLREFGYETTDSGDGVEKLALDPEADALDYPHVFMLFERADELFGAADFLLNMIEGWRGVTVPQGAIQASYDPVCGPHVLALIGFNDQALGFGHPNDRPRSWSLSPHSEIVPAHPPPPREVVALMCVPGVRRIDEIGYRRLQVSVLGDRLATPEDLKAVVPATVWVEIAPAPAWREPL